MLSIISNVSKIIINLVKIACTLSKYKCVSLKDEAHVSLLLRKLK